MLAFKTTAPLLVPPLGRPALVDRVLGVPVTVLSAPAGFGKTSLARQATPGRAGTLA